MIVMLIDDDEFTLNAVAAMPRALRHDVRLFANPALRSLRSPRMSTLSSPTSTCPDSMVLPWPNGWRHGWGRTRREPCSSQGPIPPRAVPHSALDRDRYSAQAGGARRSAAGDTLSGAVPHALSRQASRRFVRTLPWKIPRPALTTLPSRSAGRRGTHAARTTTRCVAGPSGHGWKRRGTWKTSRHERAFDFPNADHFHAIGQRTGIPAWKFLRPQNGGCVGSPRPGQANQSPLGTWRGWRRRPELIPRRSSRASQGVRALFYEGLPVKNGPRARSPGWACRG